MSLAARSLWAKKGKNGMWLPLITHMQDALFIASNLWNEWVSIGIKSRITRDIGIDEAEKLFLFLAAIHDLGKATPLFQSTPVYPIDRTLDECVWDNLRFAGLPMRSAKEFINRGKTPHALASQVLLEAAGCNRNVASIVGAHHGKPQTNHRIDARGLLAYALNYHLGQSGKDVWRAVQTEIINLALALSGFESLDGLPIPDLPNQLLLSGLLIMTDWIVSNEKYFPYLHIEQSTINVDIFERTHLAWDNLSLPPPWRISVNVDDVDLFAKRFGFTKANAMQLLALKVASSIQKPGIIVIEAPMGNGKTEAALVCAEVLADVTKRGGVYFALPTQATSDAIFPRILRWIENLGANDPHSVNLAHGKAQFNQDFENLKGFEGSTNVGNDDDGDGSLFVHEWFEGRKRTMLSDFVVGTIDQFLLAALKQKHLMLRHLGLAQKVIIIDECHAYDVYMGQYLERALQWFGAYRTPVIVLSATLPTAKRKALINAYLNVNESRDEETDLFGNTIRRGDQRVKWTVSQDYPIITYTDGMEVYQQALQTKGRTQSVHMYFLNDELIIETLETLLSQGGCAGLIVNTVGRAQAVAKELRDHFGNDVVNLFHSRFLITDRVAKEKELVATLVSPTVVDVVVF